MSISQRGEHIRTYRLCYNCLAPGHWTGDCRSVARCRSCGGKHHTMVHRDQPAAAPVANNVSPPVVNVMSATNQTISSNPTQSLPSSLMMTSQVLVKGPGGRQMVAQALLDSGASISLVSNRVAQTLQLPKTMTQVSFSGAQATPLQGAHSITTMLLSPMSSGESVFNVTAAIVSKVTCDLPLQGAAHVRNMPHIKSLSLADPTFQLPGRVDLYWVVIFFQKLCCMTILQGPSMLEYSLWLGNSRKVSTPMCQSIH